MSISDLIVVMKDGEIHQIGRPQEVYDQPADAFVAKFLGTPPINVFRGSIKDGSLCIGGAPVLPVKAADREAVEIGVRPEGFIPAENGALACGKQAVEVMGRDITIVAKHAACDNAIRAIVSAEMAAMATGETVRFDLKPNKVFAFDTATGARIAL